MLLIVTCVWSWYAMMGVHELGHVLGAKATGGRVTDVVLDFGSFSRTDVHPNPRPMTVVWAGPLVGVVAPLLIWLGVRSTWREISPLFRFFAGFCLVANGAYIGGGSFENVGDAGEMLELGSPMWVLWVYGAGCIAVGLVLWHGLGQRLGLTRNADRPHWRVMAASLGLFVLTMAVIALV